MNEPNFIDEILAEAEAGEKKLLRAHIDLLLLEISKLQEQIADNFHETEREVEILNNWTLHKNSKLNDRISYYERKLEAFIHEEDMKTIDLPNGTLKLHKKPDKVEVTDIDKFLKNAKQELVNIIPEQIKPDLNMIKKYIKLHKVIPEGVTLIEGKEEFSYKLNYRKEEQNGNETKTGTAVKSTNELRAVV